MFLSQMEPVQIWHELGDGRIVEVPPKTLERILLTVRCGLDMGGGPLEPNELGTRLCNESLLNLPNPISIGRIGNVLHLYDARAICPPVGT